MTYRTLPPAPGGRRDRRLQEHARARVMRQVALSVALTAFATGAAVSQGADGVRTAFTDQAQARFDVVGPVFADASHIEVVTRTSEQPVAPGSVTTSDPTVKSGTSKVIQEGTPGVQLVSYTVTLVNGVEVNRVPGLSVVVTPPTDQIVAVGSLVIPQTTEAQRGSNRALGQQMAADLYGWTGDQWLCLDNLWTRESNWRHTSNNTSSGAYGIPQALPGSKMAAFGADWQTNPATQIKWGLSYIQGRYGTPCGAWEHFTRKNWY